MQGNFRNGDWGEFTGKIEALHNATFYEYRYLEGHLIGKLFSTQRPPIQAPQDIVEKHWTPDGPTASQADDILGYSHYTAK